MAAGFSHILAVENGNQDAGIQISLKNFVPGGSGSGYLDPGLYEFEVADCKWVEKKGDPSKRNFYVAGKSVGPEGFGGIQIAQWIPLPVDTNDISYRKLQGLVYSMASAKGMLERVMAEESLTLTPKKILGSRFFASVSDATGEKSEGRSQFAYFCSKEEFLANPGPRAVVGKPATSPEQPSKPEIGSGNGAKTTAAAAPKQQASAIDAMFG